MPAETKISLGVVFGGRSGEHEVSLVSAQSVLAALNPNRYEITRIGITKEGAWYAGDGTMRFLCEGSTNDIWRCALSLDPEEKTLMMMTGDSIRLEQSIDVFFPVLHGTYGEDGTIQGLFEIAGIPYVGSGVVGSALAMDKGFQKILHRERGLPVVDFLCFSSQPEVEDEQQLSLHIKEQLGFPVFVKPANLGSSVGISKVKDIDGLPAAIALARSFDTKIIVERAVPHAREIEVAVLGNRDAIASCPGEIFPSNEFYDYNAKYIDGASRSSIPADLPAEMAGRIRGLALDAFHALDCAGMARIDFLLDDVSKELYLNEVNTIPGFTSISMYAKLFEAEGIPYPALLDRLIDFALARRDQEAALRRTYAPERDWHAQT